MQFCGGPKLHDNVCQHLSMKKLMGTLPVTKNCSQRQKKKGRWWEEADLIPFTSTLCQSILEWPVDKGAISPVIQPHNSSREASSRPGTAVHPKEHDARSKADIRWRQSTKFPRRVPARCFVFPQTCDNKMSQWQSMCTVHSILLTRCQSCWSWSTKMEQHQMHCACCSARRMLRILVEVKEGGCFFF